jgi:hypothetical protein
MKFSKDTDWSFIMEAVDLMVNASRPKTSIRRLKVINVCLWAFVGTWISLLVWSLSRVFF